MSLKGELARLRRRLGAGGPDELRMEVFCARSDGSPPTRYVCGSRRVPGRDWVSLGEIPGEDPDTRRRPGG